MPSFDLIWPKLNKTLHSKIFQQFHTMMHHVLYKGVPRKYLYFYVPNLTKQLLPACMIFNLEYCQAQPQENFNFNLCWVGFISIWSTLHQHVPTYLPTELKFVYINYLIYKIQQHLHMFACKIFSKRRIEFLLYYMRTRRILKSWKPSCVVVVVVVVC